MICLFSLFIDEKASRIDSGREHENMQIYRTSFLRAQLYAVVYNWKLFWAFLEDWKENVKGSLLPCYNSSEGQPLDRIIN